MLLFAPPILLPIAESGPGNVAEGFARVTVPEDSTVAGSSRRLWQRSRRAEPR